MKPYFQGLAALLMLSAATQAMAADREFCKAGYGVMLMTEGECQSYLDKRKSYQKSGDLAGIQQLDAQVQNELMERALACPCAADARVNVAMSTNDGC